MTMTCAEVNGFYFFPLKGRCEPITLVKHCTFFFEVPVPRQESKQAGIYVLGVSILSLSTILD